VGGLFGEGNFLGVQNVHEIRGTYYWQPRGILPAVKAESWCTFQWATVRFTMSSETVRQPATR
jgi:hypothetical protein